MNSNASTTCWWQHTLGTVATIAALVGAPGVACAEDIVIGQVAPFSGPQAVSGNAIHAGAALYFDAVNARGGVHGRQIRLVTRDDAQKAPETVRLTKELIASEAPAALICTISTVSLEALARDGVLQQHKTSMVGAVSGAASVVNAPYMYVTKAGYRDEISRLFKEISSLGMRRVAVLYQEDAFGQDVLSGVDTAAKKFGITVASSAGYARNTVAVEKAVGEIAKSEPQVVFVGATTAAAIEFVRQYKAAKGPGTLYGMSIVDTDAMLRALGPEGVRGFAFSVVLPLAQQTQRNLVREYAQLRGASSDKHLSARSIEGFVAAKTLVKVLEGIPKPTPENVSVALAHAKLDVGDYRIDFTERERPGSTYVDFAMFGAGGKIVQ